MAKALQVDKTKPNVTKFAKMMNLMASTKEAIRNFFRAPKSPANSEAFYASFLEPETSHEALSGSSRQVLDLPVEIHDE